MEFDHCVDLVVVGAGWNGICMAKTYHEAFAEATIEIFDSAQSVGGCWAAERLYEGLRTNNLLGSYEFSDFPMTTELTGANTGEHIPGHGVHSYLKAAVKHFDIEQSLRLGRKVESARLRDDGRWRISVSSDTSTDIVHLLAEKLVIATGLTSEPSRPVFVGQDSFSGAILHSKQLKAQGHQLVNAKKVVVIGGNKSAFDVCYSVAQQGGQTHMLTRRSGGGPSWIWPRSIKFAGFRTSLSKLSLTRIWCLFDPWPFGSMGKARGILRRILHCTVLGRCLTNAFWIVLGNCARRENACLKHKDTALLAPGHSTYWMGNSLSVNNYPSDWFDHVRAKRIVVHRAEIATVCGRDVTTTTSTIADVDAIVCCTGWKHAPSLCFEPSIPEICGTISDHEIDFAIAARRQVSECCPALRSRAEILPRAVASKDTPMENDNITYRLYRCVIPRHPRLLCARNLAFIGIDFSLHTVMLAQAQALWITAFFSDNIAHLHDNTVDYERISQEAILFSEYEKLRRPSSAGGSGEKFPDFVFDSLPYVDLLLDDLNLKPQRKQNWFQELFCPYSLKDYRGLISEWKLSAKVVVANHSRTS